MRAPLAVLAALSAGALLAPAALAAPRPPGGPPPGACADLGSAGQLVLATVPGAALDDGTRRLIRAQHLGGVVLFGVNVRGGSQLRALTRDLHAAAGPRGLLITTDQEGGSVRRVPAAGPVLSARAAGALGPGYVRAARAAAGRDLRALGVDVDLAPVADLDRGGFLGSRAYGRAPSADVAAAVVGLRAGGVGATVKHFPGLGGVARSTDDAPARGPRVGGPALAPFAAGVRAGAAMVMVDLAVHPGLGPLPAALSEPAYRLLRGPSVGVRGVAVTDAIDAGAARAVGTEEQVAVRAVRAGADMVIVPGGPAAGARAMAALQAAVRGGAIPASRYAEALGRVRALLAAPSRPPLGPPHPSLPATPAPRLDPVALLPRRLLGTAVPGRVGPAA